MTLNQQNLTGQGCTEQTQHRALASQKAIQLNRNIEQFQIHSKLSHSVSLLVLIIRKYIKTVINFALNLLIKRKLPALLQCIMICCSAMIKINTYICRFSVTIFRANRPIDCIFLCLQVRNRQRNSPTYWGPRFCHLNNIRPRNRTYLFNNKDKWQYLHCFSLDATFSHFNLL